MIPPQIEAGTGAELEQAQWQCRLPRGEEKAAHQGRAAAHLVGLHPALEQGPQLLAVLEQSCGEGWPRVAGPGIAARRRQPE